MQGQNHRSRNHREFRRDLRKNPTEAEKCLWKRLRGAQIDGLKFRRQHPFGGYVLDFVSLEKSLIVEVDGSQHQNSEHDRLRDSRLRAAGFRILRFWDNQVLTETDAVVETIWRALTESIPPPDPPLQEEGQGGDGVSRLS